MSQCHICNLHSNCNPERSFFRFPKELKRCLKWAEIANLTRQLRAHGPLYFNKYLRICSDHFNPEFIRFDGRKKRLLANAVPDTNLKSTTLSKKENESTDAISGALKIDDMMSFSDVEFEPQLMDNLCRLCSEKNLNLLPIFGERGKLLELNRKLKFIPIVVKMNDGLPNKICPTCLKKVLDVHNFITDCLKANEILHGLMDLGNVGESEISSSVQGSLHHSLSNVESTAADHNQDQKRNFCYVDFSTSYSLQHDYSELWMKNVTADKKLEWRHGISYQCKLCKKNFKTIDALRGHKKAHMLAPDNNGKFRCAKCAACFTDRYRLCEHERLHTGEKPYKCAYCEKRFHRSILLRQHRKTHSNERFECNNCKRSFSRKSQLSQHLAGCLYSKGKSEKQIIKTFGWPPFEKKETIAACTESQNSHLKAKTQSHNDEKKSEDNAPQTMFVNIIVADGYAEANLKTLPLNSAAMQQKTAEENKVFTCGQCKKSYTTPFSLNRHIEVHQAEIKKCKCSTCGQSFGRMDTLKRHFRIHTGERPFACKICGFAFKQKGDCTKHEINHYTAMKLS